MNLLQDIITYVRRLIKTPSNAVITDNLIIDYINRFWIMDVDARIQLFDLKTKYQFQTAPGFDQYNVPMYQLQTEPGNQTISYYPVYQGFTGWATINGIQIPLQTQRQTFFNLWPNIVQQMNIVRVGDGAETYSFRFPISPNQINPINTPLQYICRGHVDIQGIMALINLEGYASYEDPPNVTNSQANGAIGSQPIGTIQGVPTANAFPGVYLTANAADGRSIVVCDSGQFLDGNQQFGLLMIQGQAPNGNRPLGNYSTTENVINYLTGEVFVTFPEIIPFGVNINAQCYYYQSGLPRGILFENNTLLFRSPPDKQYLVELEAYLTPAGFLSTNQAIQFGYMCEYIARGAARKILSDTGDIEQFQFYEPFFIEQEMLVWKRSQRQFTANRTQTIYSQGPNMGHGGYGGLGGSSI